MRQLLGVLLAALCIALVPSVAQAYCFQEAQQAYGVDARLLCGIAKTESSLRADVVHPVNSNGSRDYCLMGINDGWFPVLQAHGVSPVQVIRDPCTCVMVGAWIVARLYKQYGVSWKAIGHYNAKTEWKANRYAWKIWQAVYGPQNKQRGC